MKNIHIENSYNIWTIPHMKSEIWHHCRLRYNTPRADLILHRSWASMYIEWWLHNIGYYLTLPFCEYDFIRRLNLRFRDVDLEEHRK